MISEGGSGHVSPPPPQRQSATPGKPPALSMKETECFILAMRRDADTPDEGTAAAHSSTISECPPTGTTPPNLTGMCSDSALTV